MTRRHRRDIRIHQTRNNRNIIMPPVSSRTIQVLKQSWDLICKSDYHLPDTTQLDEKNINTIRSQPMYNYIPEEIRREFESTEQQGFKTEFALPRGRKVIIYVVLPIHKLSPSSGKVQMDVREYVNRVIKWLYFIDRVASQQCAQTLNIYLLLTDAKKQVPIHSSVQIDMVHANTAFTTSCSPKNDIFIFRREEWFKVFMHETFHCFGLDFSAHSNSDSNKCILSIFPAIDPNIDVRLYETFCEMWAELFHMLFCLFYVPLDSYGDKLNDTCLPFSKRRFIRTLSNERIFSIYQSNKLLMHSGYKYKDLFSAPKRGKSYYTEKTPAFSYYVIKSLMLWNLDMFIDWCLKYASSHNNSPPIQFKENNIAKYCDFVMELTQNDKRYRRATEQIFYPKRRSFNIAKSLRMTSIDIEE